MLEIKIKGRTILIPDDDIIYMESQDRKLAVYTKNGSYECYEKISGITTKLDDRFFMVHRSFVINFSYVMSYNRTQIVLAGGTIIPMSKYRYRDFVSAYLKYGSG